MFFKSRFLRVFRFLALGFLLFPPLQSTITISQFLIEPDDGVSLIFDLIRSSKKTIDLVIFEFTDPEIISALISAQQRGIEVRVLFDHAYFNDAAYNVLNDAGVKVKFAEIHEGALTHQKTFIFDGEMEDGTALVMTLNLEPVYSTTRDAAVLVTSPDDVKEILDVFNADWDRYHVDPYRPDLVWSPTNSYEKILRLIRDATSTLDIYTEELSDTQVENALIAAVQRGVRVRFILSPPTNQNLFGQIYPFSTDDNYEGVQKVNQGGVQVRLIAVPYIHCKSIISDYHTDHQKVFLGSQNFSAISLLYNRELGVILDSSQPEQVDFINRLEATFEYDWDVVKGL